MKNHFIYLDQTYFIQLWRSKETKAAPYKLIALLLPEASEKALQNLSALAHWHPIQSATAELYSSLQIPVVQGLPEEKRFFMLCLNWINKREKLV